MHERGLAEEFGVFCCLAYSVRIRGANGRRFCAIACHGVGAYQGQLDHNDAHVVPFARTLGRWPWPFGRLAASQAILGARSIFCKQLGEPKGTRGGCASSDKVDPTKKFLRCHLRNFLDASAHLRNFLDASAHLRNFLDGI